MRALITAIVSLSILAACTRGSGGGSGSGPGKAGTTNANGGVDVGNMNSKEVPRTYALMSYSGSWSATADADTLKIQNRSGSLISAKKSEIKDLSSPNAIGLQQYMEAKFPDRQYKMIKINGLEGVRAELMTTDAQKKSDIYLVSELNDFIHIESDLKKEDGGIAAGDKIILTVRVEYKGVAYPNSKPKTVTLPTYDFSKPDHMKAAYSPLGDCYSYVDRNCTGVSLINVNDTHFGIAGAGYDHGRIIELGPESEVPFDAIKIDGKYLEAPLSRVALSDIYTAFTPKDQHRELDTIEPKPGFVYLLRTISWPNEDLIVKFRIDRVEAGKAVTLTYEKLAYVKPEQLQKQVDIINKNTLENEQPQAMGEVTLYSRTIWNNYFNASFNFEYSTSGNMFITNNNWDLMFSSPSNRPGFVVPRTGSGIGEVIDVGARDLNEISLTDFPDPNAPKPASDVKVITGHTYLVYHFEYDGKATYGAVQVLELDPNSEWVRLKFKRVAIQTVGYFQNWIPLALPQSNSSVTLELGQDYAKAIFLPFINKRGDQGSHYYESIAFEAGSANESDSLRIDSRPYGDKRGFFKFPKGTALDSVTQNQIESLRGKFTSKLDLQKGDVVAVLLENFYDKTVIVMKVEELVPQKSVQLSLRYLYRGKTAYSDDKD